MLSVNSDALVAVRNLAITNGNAALGGGIDVEGGSVSLIDASVTDNKATNGGGSSTSRVDHHAQWPRTTFDRERS